MNSRLILSELARLKPGNRFLNRNTLSSLSLSTIKHVRALKQDQVYLPNRSLSTSIIDNNDEFPPDMNVETRELAKSLRKHLNSDNETLETTQQQQWKSRVALSKTITLIESTNPLHNEQAAHLLTYLLRKSSKPYNNVFRVGMAGPPGAGKSTLIESLGRYILDLGTPTDLDEIWKPGNLSVVCIDPSSVTSGGSILGDKTRMMELSRDYRAFVRPAPTQGAWGGLAP